MKERSIETLRLDGGCLVFDFINTVNTRVEEDYHEYLGNYEEFIKWCRKAATIDDTEANEILKTFNSKKDQGKSALNKIIEAREELFIFFERISSDSLPDKSNLDQFNSLLSNALAHVQVNDQLEKYIPIDPKDLISPLHRIVLSAYETLLEIPKERIKKCDACAWLFVDSTKNGKRRFCSPETCGSVDKAKRYYYRKKAENN